MNVVEWLLDGDPSIRWQVMRDLTDEPADVVAAERSRVASEGWGARLLGLQAPDGRWGEGSYSTWNETPEGSATNSLVLLREMGLDPTSEEAQRAVTRIRDNITWGPEFDNAPFFDGEVEPCINGRILGLGAYFGEASDQLLDRLLHEQLEDGGWNCEAPPSVRSSFHTTICVLEGLLEYDQAMGPVAEVTEARGRGQDYLLERHLLRSLSSGQVINGNWTLFSFPTGWHYDVLRGLNYLRKAGVDPDDRIIEAIGVVKENRREDGRWPLQNPDPYFGDLVPFDMEEGTDTPSRWNTLRALRVLNWAGHAADIRS